VRIGAIVLAGGRSERFGGPKQLLPWHGQPLIEAIVREVCRVRSLTRVVVVLRREVAERLRRTVGSRRIRQRTTGEDLGTVTLSIGVGQAARDDTPEEWIERVDRALYRAKRRGRDCVVVTDPPPHEVSLAEIAFSAPDDDVLAPTTGAPRTPAEGGQR
jgi:2-C-methyl-D-erythritol 4-phosphate cytidylyltransferase